MIDMGATTMWERWDAVVKGRKGVIEQSSRNHWPLGSVGEWVWRELAGINPDDEQPGYKHFVIRPRPCPGLTWVKAEYDSIRGKIVSDWKIEDGKFVWDVTIPPNATATVYVPAKKGATVTEGGKPADQSPGLKFLRHEDGAAVFSAVSGHYSFRSQQEPS
jgi:alpha-L-rhamnosidase